MTEILDGRGVGVTRADHTSGKLRALSEQNAQIMRRFAGCWAWPWSSTAVRAAGRRHWPAWTGKPWCDWVHRYNASGVEGLKSRCPPGRVPALTEEQRAELRELVVKRPDPATDKVVRWRCVDLRTVVAQRFSVTVHVRTISKWLNQFRLTGLQPRPVHPKKDPEAEVTFKKNFASLAKAALLHTTAATPLPLEIWFQDEARVGQQGTHAYIWAPVGVRPLMVRDNRHESAYLFGAICPDRGVGAAMITPHANTEAMNLHLGEVSTQVTPGVGLCWFAMALVGISAVGNWWCLTTSPC
jgi:transposase